MKYLSLFLLLWVFPLFASDLVFVGDSLSAQCFGKTMYASLTNKSKLRVSFSALCGTSPINWMPGKHNVTKCGFRFCENGSCREGGGAATGPSLRSILQRENPKITVVALGTNMLGHTNSMTTVQQLIQDIKAERPDGKCVWIGPGQVKTKVISVANYLDFVANLKKAVTVAGCDFIDSDPYTDRIKMTDPIHPSCPAQTSWADRLYAQKLGPLLAGVADDSAPPLGIIAPSDSSR